MNDPQAQACSARSAIRPIPRSSTPSRRWSATARTARLSRINVLKFAAERKLDEEKTISAFLHASRLGLFELNWNVLCPGCGGVLDSSQQLKSVHKEAYDCALCSRAYEPTLDEMVEVVFTVSPRVRRIAAHDPHLLPLWEYFRQIFWGTGIDLPEDNFVEQMEEFTIDAMEIGPGEKAQIVAAPCRPISSSCSSR